LHRPGRFFDLFVVQSAERQLRRMERDSIATVDRRGGTEGDERFVPRRQLGVP
jgi:hypothetical protein